MSLVRLLTSGKTLVGFQDAPNGYRVPRQRLLPQFGPARNPFRSTTKSGDGRAQALSLQDTGSEDAGGAHRRISGPSGLAATALKDDARDRTAAGKTGERGRTVALRGGAASLLNAGRAKLSGWLGAARGQAGKPALPRFTKQPVQGELSLAQVRVVRNDLSETDLKIVPARQPVARSMAGPATPEAAKTGISESRWGRVASRLFGAGRT